MREILKAIYDYPWPFVGISIVFLSVVHILEQLFEVIIKTIKKN